MNIVSSGRSFIDIDAYGGCVAYAELLNTQGRPAQVVSTAPLNISITPSLRSLDVQWDTAYKDSPQDVFTLIDVSDPKFVDTFVDIDRVDTVIDHHAGFEEFWQGKIGNSAHIEFIGAACTLVYEAWKAALCETMMSKGSAQLLAAGIVDNTLHFKSDLTTERDRQAYEELLAQAGLAEDWVRDYLHEYEQLQEVDLEAAIKDDYKQLIASDTLPEVIGQLLVWEESVVDFLARHLGTIQTVMDAITENWWMNVIAIEDGKSYYLAASLSEEQKLAKLMNVTFRNRVAMDKRLVLRKEILKAGLAASKR